MKGKEVKEEERGIVGEGFGKARQVKGGEVVKGGFGREVVEVKGDEVGGVERQSM